METDDKKIIMEKLQKKIAEAGICILLEECKHGGLYRIHARNFDFGIYDEKQQGFIGVREKFGNTYLFIEFHRDNNTVGKMFGTVNPKELLEMCPVKDLGTHFLADTEKYIENKELRKWLDDKIKKYDTTTGDKK